jgi:hypothetical protein
MEIEDRLKDLEWRLRYHKVMINVLALLVLASAGSRVWEQFSGPGEMTVTQLSVVNDEGQQAVHLGTLPNGAGVVSTHSSEGKPMVFLGANRNGNGKVWTFSPEGKKLVVLGTTTDGNGGVWTTTKSRRKKRLD